MKNNILYINGILTGLKEVELNDFTRKNIKISPRIHIQN